MVRAVVESLVPGTMSLMGDWNRWAPAPLRQFHIRFGLQEFPHTRAAVVPDDLSALDDEVLIRR